MSAFEDTLVAELRAAGHVHPTVIHRLKKALGFRIAGEKGGLA